VRAGRLITMLRLLQGRGRMSAKDLARELEVSERTVLRDIEALSGAGVPVYAIRGRHGGFALLSPVREELPLPDHRPDPTRRGGMRARVRLSPRGRQLAAVLGRPAGVRIRKHGIDVQGREDWIEASVRMDSVASAVPEMLALGAEVEIVRPAELRGRLHEAGRRIAVLNAGQPVHHEGPEPPAGETTSGLGLAAGGPVAGFDR
jgi:predicted DNA-binding transcriptional regulator YafY